MTDTLLEVQNVTHEFSLSKTACVRALDRLSFSIRRARFTVCRRVRLRKIDGQRAAS